MATRLGLSNRGCPPPSTSDSSPAAAPMRARSVAFSSPDPDCPGTIGIRVGSAATARPWRILGPLAANAAVAMACLLPLPGALAANLALTEKFPPIPSEHRTLSDVPFAKGAPAVVLLEAQQNEPMLGGEDYTQRVIYLRRVKLLTAAGVEDWSDFSMDVYGDWRVQKVLARTVLPDGTEVDASENTFREGSGGTDDSSSLHAIRVAFPRAQVGAILDVIVVANEAGVPYERWLLQKRLPVLESRFILTVPENLKLRIVTVRMPPEAAKRTTERRASGTANIWRWENVQPIPEEPNQPPLEDMSQALIVVPDSYKDELQYVAITADWKSYSKNEKERLDRWLGKKHSALDALARQAAEGSAALQDKAEAVRRILREKVRLDYHGAFRSADSPDEVLTRGLGTSGDLAGAAVSMLRSLGLQAVPAALRRRGHGTMPPDFPLPMLLDDVVVRVGGEVGGLWLHPASDLKAGTLPWECRGVPAILLDGAADKPITLPDFKAGENRITRTIEATLDPTGAISGETTETYHGVSAANLREALRPLDETRRKETVRDRLREHLPGAEVTTLALANLDADETDLVVKVQWRAERYATLAGKKLIVNPNLHSRLDASDWAAAERKFEIDLGGPHETISTLSLRLPEGAKDVTLPPSPATMNAGPVGLFEASVERREGVVIARRHMRLDVYQFQTRSWPGLKRWFGDIAAQDDKPLVLTLP